MKKKAKAKKGFRKAPARKKPVRRAAPSKAKRISNKPKRASAVRKKSKKRPKTPAPTVVAPPNSELLGRVETYFAKIGVMALTLVRPVALGAHLHILGHTTNFEQTLDSLQIDRRAVIEAKPKDAIGIKVMTRARGGDYVYLIRA